MAKKSCVQASQRSRDTVVIVGGKGGLEEHYKKVVERFGYEFSFYEQRIVAKKVPNRARIAMVIVMVGMISHPLMAHARELADSGSSLVYLRTPSVSGVRAALEMVQSGSRATAA
jgi:hypothetical protein